MTVLLAKAMRPAIVFLLLMLSNASYGETVIRSGPTQANLIELYTSEGCSSCPPADRWISGLKDHPALWDQLVPVAFHVDYWDYIGWKDRFAQTGFTDRQRRYAREKGLPTVYTPALMSNGREWRNFRWQAPTAATTGTPGSLVIEVAADELQISFEPVETLVAENLTVSGALLGFGLSSQVSSGENAGRELNHDFVVLELAQTEMHIEDGLYHATLRRPQSTVQSERYGLAFWVSRNDEQKPLQAAGGWLE